MCCTLFVYCTEDAGSVGRNKVHEPTKKHSSGCNDRHDRPRSLALLVGAIGLGLLGIGRRRGGEAASGGVGGHGLIGGQMGAHSWLIDDAGRLLSALLVELSEGSGEVPRLPGPSRPPGC